MVSDAEMLDEIDAGLAHASALLLAAAEKIHVRIQASDESDEIAGLTKSLEGATRSLRLTYGLRAKLRRDATRAFREDQAEQAKRDRQLVAFRRDRVRTAVQALWRETDWEGDPDLDVDLFQILMEESEADTFLTEDLGDQVARVLNRLGYEIAPDGRVRKTAHPRECQDRDLSFDSSA